MAMMSKSETEGGNAIMTVQGLTLIRNGVRLLDDISTTIRSGRITVLLGHNGAGKTLFLSCLHGLIGYEAGRIEGPPRASQKMVFQKPIILRRSARHHLEFICPDIDRKLLEELMGRAGLAERIDAPARALSGGEQQKLALIGAIAAKPDILFLDEPTSHLDFEATEFIEAMITEAHANGTTIMLTTHNRAQAERLGEDILLLDRGELIEVAPADQFFHSPKHPIARQYLAHL